MRSRAGNQRRPQPRHEPGLGNDGAGRNPLFRISVSQVLVDISQAVVRFLTYRNVPPRYEQHSDLPRHIIVRLPMRESNLFTLHN